MGQRYEALGSDEHDASNEDFPLAKARSYSWKGKCAPIMLQIVLLLSLSVNIVVFMAWTRDHKMASTSMKTYTHLPYDTPVQYQSTTDWWGDNDTLAEELWYNLETSASTIVLSDQWASEHGLDISQRYPWDQSKGLYTIKAFHQMHCLKLLRRSLLDFDEQGESRIEIHHLLHCLDSLRQDLMCIADDTIMSTIHVKHRIGNGQIRQCRDWEQLVAWAKTPERNSCFNLIDEYATTKHGIENFAFCPEDSPYYNTMAAYFQKHGHRDPFSD